MRFAKGMGRFAHRMRSSSFGHPVYNSRVTSSREDRGLHRSSVGFPLVRSGEASTRREQLRGHPGGAADRQLRHAVSSSRCIGKPSGLRNILLDPQCSTRRSPACGSCCQSLIAGVEMRISVPATMKARAAARLGVLLAQIGRCQTATPEKDSSRVFRIQPDLLRRCGRPIRMAGRMRFERA